MSATRAAAADHVSGVKPIVSATYATTRSWKGRISAMSAGWGGTPAVGRAVEERLDDPPSALHPLELELDDGQRLRPAPGLRDEHARHGVGGDDAVAVAEEDRLETRQRLGERAARVLGGHAGRGLVVGGAGTQPRVHDRDLDVALALELRPEAARRLDDVPEL